MKPEWCPQEIWDQAEMLVVSVDGVPTEGGIYNVARALLEAHQRGMEEASNHNTELEKEIEHLREMAYS